MEMIKCKNCGSKFSRSDNLRRHEKSCVVKTERETLLETSVTNNNDAKSNDDSPILVNRINNDGISVVKKDDSKWTRFIDTVINKDPDSGSSIIQPLKSSTTSETAKKRNITHPGSENESSEDGSIVDHPLVKKQKLDKTDPVNKISSVHEAAKKLNIIPAYDSEDESIVSDEYEDDSDFENKDFVQGKGRENYNVRKNADDYESKQELKPLQLKARLYTSGSKIKVFELDLDVDRALNNIDLLEYVRLLKIPNFRDVFHIDELPKRVNDIECGIVNLSPHEQLGTHWVSYVKNHTTRIYFDSFGRKTPLEIQKYMKTAKEFRNDAPVIQSNTDIVQRVNTKICGHLCLFVLTSLMREHYSFPQVMDQLNYAFAEYYY